MLNQQTLFNIFPVRLTTEKRKEQRYVCKNIKKGLATPENDEYDFVAIYLSGIHVHFQQCEKYYVD